MPILASQSRHRVQLIVPRRDRVPDVLTLLSDLGAKRADETSDGRIEASFSSPERARAIRDALCIDGAQDELV